MRRSVLLACFAMAGFVCLPACEPKKVDTPAHTHDHEHGDHDHDHKSGGKDSHDHAHDHSHEHGEHGGHLEHFSPSDSHFEWVHDDNAHKLTVYVEELASKGAKIESMKIEVVSGTDTKSFDLELDPKAKIAGSVYTITNEELMVLVGASSKDEKGVQAKLIAKINGATETALLQHDHGHHH